MTTLSFQIDAQTESGLRRLIGQDGDDVTEVAARLLGRAVRAARPRFHFDLNAIRAANSEFADEDEKLAESASEDRASLLEREDLE